MCIRDRCDLAVHAARRAAQTQLNMQENADSVAVCHSWQHVPVRCQVLTGQARMLACLRPVNLKSGNRAEGGTGGAKARQKLPPPISPHTGLYAECMDLAEGCRACISVLPGVA
eukprot:2523945-Rhodomonas_salina.1